MQINGRKKFVSEINVTPFVDVMLVLLIIFMVTAPLLTEGLDVNLPATKEAASMPAETENLVLSITKSGEMYLGQIRVEMENLDKVLRETVTDQQKQLFLQADRDVPYGTVVEAMGMARGAGILNIGVVARKPDAGE